jgi:hypothetical protein
MLFPPATRHTLLGNSITHFVGIFKLMTPRGRNQGREKRRKTRQATVCAQNRTGADLGVDRVGSTSICFPLSRRAGAQPVMPCAKPAPMNRRPAIPCITPFPGNCSGEVLAQAGSSNQPGRRIFSRHRSPPMPEPDRAGVASGKAQPAACSSGFCGNTTR